MLAVGSVLAGRYRLLELISHGGMGSVYAARDEVLDRRVAIKVARITSAVDRRRFDRETRTLAGLAHSNLVAVFDAGEEDGELYIVLELIEGPTLADRIATNALDGDQVRLIALQLGSALAHIHAQGVTHRDVKPSNVLIDRHGNARLGDFGVALTPDATALTATATTVGTAAYMAPEQLDGNEATPKVDVYALGLVLLECLTGVRPFPGPAHEAALARLARDPQVPDDLPEPWPALLRSMTARQPADRPDAATIATRLSTPTDAATAPLASTLPTVRLAGPAVTALRPDGRWRPLLLWISAAALAVIAAVALLGDDSDTPSISPGTTVAPASSPSTTLPPSTAPASTEPAIDCAALEAERDALEQRKREIDQQYRDDRETRERLKAEIEARKREVEAQLRDHCR